MVYKIFGVTVSPFVGAAAICAGLLGVDYEVVMTRPHSDDPEFVKASPFGKIPALADGDFTLADSTAIIAYIDAQATASGKKSLFGDDAQSRGKIVFLEKYIQNDALVISTKLFGQFMKDREDKEAISKLLDQTPPVLMFLEESMQENGHFVGDRYTVADVVAFTHLSAFQNFGSLEAYPKLTNFYKKAAEEPVFAKTKKEAQEILASIMSQN